MKHYLSFFCVALLLSVANQSVAYPLDAYPATGIRRIEAARLAVLGKMPGRQQPPGALLPTASVDIRLLDHPDLVLPEPDPEFTARILQLLGDKADRYGVALLDLSDPAHPRYAEHRADVRQNVGSVGKIAVAVAVFQALADMYPDDIEARKRLLREAVITADPAALFAPFTEGRSDPLAEWRQWPSMRAVRDEALFLLPADAISRATPRWLDSLELACTLMHGLRERMHP